MVDPLAKRYIISEVKKHQINKEKDEIFKVINEYETIEKLGKAKVCFTFFWGPKIYSACALPPSKTILISADWAIKVILEDDYYTKNALITTIGHELSHLDGFFIYPARNQNDFKFIRWVTEICCDFGAANKLLGNSRERLLMSMDYKIELKKNMRNYPIYPSWQQRKYYAENFNFDEELIREVAKEVECKNDKLINEALKYFENRYVILLNN